MRLAVVCAYRLPDQSTIEQVPNAKGPASWAVRNGFSECLNQSGQWEHEPQPSSRTEAFLARCRFETAELAYAAWEASIDPSSQG